MSNTIAFTREIPVRHQVDVFIAGARDLSVHEMNISLLKERLLALGAYLPNA